MNESLETMTKPEAGQTLAPTAGYTAGQRVKKGTHTGTVTGKTGEWYHIDWDGGWKPHCCNYYGAWEFEAV